LSAVVPQQLRRINFGYGRAHFIKMLKQLTLVTCVEDSVLWETIGKVTQESAKTHLILISGELDSAAAEILSHKRAKGHVISIFLFKLETFGKRDVNIINREKLILRLKGSGIRVTTLEKDSDLRLILGRPVYGAG
ncbi:MAG TPA: hypothetical protein VNT57_05355, partial [Desulfobacteria bacterium]|nr:hypothetical protein [Desulfobacteria bacterium]